MLIDAITAHHKHATRFLESSNEIDLKNLGLQTAKLKIQEVEYYTVLATLLEHLITDLENGTTVTNCYIICLEQISSLVDSNSKTKIKAYKKIQSIIKMYLE